MKRIIISLSILIAAINMTAQSTLLTKSLVTLNEPSWVHEYPLKAIDSLGAVQDSILFTYFINTSDSIRFHAKITLHEVANNCKSTVILKGYNFSGDTPTNIDTVIYWGSVADTTFVVHAPMYNYYQIVGIRNANKSKFTKLNVYYKKK